MLHFLFFLWYLYTRYQFLVAGIGVLALLGGFYLSYFTTGESLVLRIIPFAIAGCMMSAPMWSNLPAMGRWSRRFIYRNGIETEAVIVKVHPTRIRVGGHGDEAGTPVGKYEIALMLPDGSLRQMYFFDAFYIDSFYPNERGMASTPAGTKLKIRYLPRHPDNFVIVNDRYEQYDKDLESYEQEKEAEKEQLIAALKNRRSGE